MAIQLPADEGAGIRQKAGSGHFADAGEVVREAMRLLDDYEQRLASLREKLKIGLDRLVRGEGVEWTPELKEQLSREADDMHRRGERPDPDVRP